VRAPSSIERLVGDGSSKTSREAEAGRAGAVGAVEGEVARGERLEADAAVGAGVPLGVERLARLGLALGLRERHQHALAVAQGQLDRVGEARADRRRDDEPVPATSIECLRFTSAYASSSTAGPSIRAHEALPPAA
jgi:hypothetical protein